MFLVRKISRAKWPGDRELSGGEIPADAVTIDLQTDGNALSFWECPTDESDDIEAVALALAAGRDSLQKLEIVWIADDEIIQGDVTIEKTVGRTPVTDLATTHVSMPRLDYSRLGTVAKFVVSALEANQHRVITKPRVKTMLVRAVEEGRIDVGDLKDKLRDQIT